MMNLNAEHRLQQARRAEALRRAAKNGHQPIPANNRQPALARLGEVLSSIGDGLQERYGSELPN